MIHLGPYAQHGHYYYFQTKIDLQKRSV